MLALGDRNKNFAFLLFFYRRLCVRGLKAIIVREIARLPLETSLMPKLLALGTVIALTMTPHAKADEPPAAVTATCGARPPIMLQFCPTQYDCRVLVRRFLELTHSDPTLRGCKLNVSDSEDWNASH